MSGGTYHAWVFRVPERELRGITSWDFTPGQTMDDKRPGAQFAARVRELREAGHTIRSVERRGNLAVYVLSEE